MQEASLDLDRVIWDIDYRSDVMKVLKAAIADQAGGLPPAGSGIDGPEANNAKERVASFAARSVGPAV